MQTLPKEIRRPSLFWDVNPEEIDIEENASYIIERIIEHGRDDEVGWMWRTYGPEVIRRTTERSRAIRPKSKPLWLLLTAAN